MAMTVTATQGGGTFNGMGMTVLVLTGAQPAAAQPGGSAAVANTETVGYDQAVTVAATGSVIYGAIANGDINSAWTPDARTTMLLNFASAAHATTWGTFQSTAATSATGSTIYGATNGAGDHGAYAAAEILASGTIAQDASTPSPASSDTDTATTLTSASFTPVAGSLIVVMVATNSNDATITMAISDTAGLTWHQLAWTAGDSYEGAGVWAADVPGPAATPGPPLTAQLMGASPPVVIASLSGWRGAQHSR